MKQLKLIEYTFGYTGKYCTKVARFLHTVQVGLEEGYPICCVAHFSFDYANDYKVAPALSRGSIRRSPDSTYVPCIFHKRRHPLWEPYEKYGRKYGQLKLFEAPPTKSASDVYYLSMMSKFKRAH